jgi:hypothetical protein
MKPRMTTAVGKIAGCSAANCISIGRYSAA